MVSLRRVIQRCVLVPDRARLELRRIVLTARGARIHRSAVIGPCSIEGRYGHLTVGARSVIGRARIIVHAPVTIGRHAVLNDEVLVLTASHEVESPHWRGTTAPVSIGDYAWVAMRATILPGVTIGEGAVVGACSVVTRDVAPYAVVAGNPARVCGQRAQPLEYDPTALVPAFTPW